VAARVLCAECRDYDVATLVSATSTSMSVNKDKRKR
jgi:hypothetical protein